MNEVKQPAEIKNSFILFFRAWIQVFLVSLNTYFVAAGIVIGIFVASWSISFVWSLNVAKMSNPKRKDQIIYSTGAALGGICGFYFGKLIHFVFSVFQQI